MNKLLTFGLMACIGLVGVSFPTVSQASWLHKEKAVVSSYNENPGSVPVFEKMDSNTFKHKKFKKFERKNGYKYRKYRNCFLHMKMFCGHREATITPSGL